MAQAITFILVVLVVALTRLIPHPPNFTPILALALFGGAKAPSRWMAYAAPVVALWLTDLIIGTHSLMGVVALAILAATMIGELAEGMLRGKSAGRKILGWGLSGLLASAVFFFVTNFAVWVSSGIYPHDAQGLWTCFVLALPFFHNQVLSTWLLSGMIFGVWTAVAPMLRAAHQTHRFH